MSSKLVFFFILSLLSLSCAQPSCPNYDVQVFTKAARGRGGLRFIVNRFQSTLGGEDNGSSPGPLSSGRRSINWDAPGSVLPFDMPFNFFERTVTRGFVFQAAGRKFAVSNDGSGDDRFSSLLPRSQSRRFRTFSPPRLFTPVNNNRVGVVFKIPTKNQRAATAGFGTVLTDVDIDNVTWIDFYARNGCLIKRVFAPKMSRGLSFVGIIVKGKSGENIPVIWRVVMKLGNVSVRRFRNDYRPSKFPGDLVVVDDIIIGEQQA